jgi:hypothetical protein
MKEPLKAGDICEVVMGLTRRNSPNIGLIVTVGKRIMGEHGMNHTRYGPVHRCENPDIQQLGDNGEFIKTGWADFPDAWLKKIEPPKLIKALERVLEKEE